MLFDKAYAEAQEEDSKRFILYEKAILLHKNNDLKGALSIYNNLVEEYNKNKDTGFAIDHVYYYRSLVRDSLGDKAGASSDRTIVGNMCSNCQFDMELDLVELP